MNVVLVGSGVKSGYGVVCFVFALGFDRGFGWLLLDPLEGAEYSVSCRHQAVTRGCFLELHLDVVSLCVGFAAGSCLGCCIHERKYP